MNENEVNGRVGHVMNGALVIIALFSTLSIIYPNYSSLIFFGSCVLTAVAFGVAVKIIRVSKIRGCDVESDSISENDVSLPRNFSVQVDAEKGDPNSTVSEISNVHPDAYWKIIEQITARERENKARRTAEDFSITLNIINIYTSAGEREELKSSPEKISYVLMPELHNGSEISQST